MFERAPARNHVPRLPLEPHQTVGRALQNPFVVRSVVIIEEDLPVVAMASPNPFLISPAADTETGHPTVNTRYSPATPEALALYAAAGAGNTPSRPGALAASPFSSSFGVKDNMTLADIRKKAIEDKEFGRESAHLRRYRVRSAFYLLAVGLNGYKCTNSHLPS